MRLTDAGYAFREYAQTIMNTWERHASICVTCTRASMTDGKLDDF